jgi:hypothetical protein
MKSPFLVNATGLVTTNTPDHRTKRGYPNMLFIVPNAYPINHQWLEVSKTTAVVARTLHS